MEKISAVYQIINTETGDRYVGSSRNVKSRWANHKCPSTWKECPNNPMYKDMQEYGVDKFRFQILAPVMPDYLKDVEQEFIEMLNPTYNSMNAKGLNVERYKEYCKEYHKEYDKEYRNVHKEHYKEYNKEYNKEYSPRYNNQLCVYNGETLKLCTLAMRFHRAGIEHPTVEAKKYLSNKQ